MGGTENKKHSLLAWILEVLKLVAIPFMPAINGLIRVIKIILESEFLTPQGKMNLAGLAIAMLGIAIVSISPLLILAYRQLVFGDYSVNFDSPIGWIIGSFAVCIVMVTSENMFSMWLKAKFGNKG